jgi:molybdopterin synthase catalytic subunit
MAVKSRKTMFLTGAVTPTFIANSIAKHSSQTAIGAHQLFLGQIRADQTDLGVVSAIEFSAYEEMGDKLYSAYREVLFKRYAITCLHVHHSIGQIQVGEINLFVFVSAMHRKDAILACADLVEWIKNEVPVWGKLIYDTQEMGWKENNNNL